ncbi:MAG TPA: hypothetical protein DCZ73_10935 [Bacteroides sp.]|nr:hypothetical protein [Bacteroides sp.]
MNINDTSRKIHAKIRQICEIPNIFLLKNSNLLLEKLGCGLLTAFFKKQECAGRVCWFVLKKNDK